MTGTNCNLFTHKSSRSYLNHLVFTVQNLDINECSRILELQAMSWSRVLFVRL
jgi:hypothetical protein